MTSRPTSATDLTSAARRINGERLVLTGWSRAILLQMAHPLIAAGVAEHSAFRGGPRVAAHRLQSTVRAMLGLTFGDQSSRQRVVDHIRAIHRRVNGTLRETTGMFEAGTRYSAEDPALLLWVHATLLDSTIIAFRAIVGDLNDQDLDAYCADAAPVAIDLGANPAEVPRTFSALASYMHAMHASGVLAVGADGRAVAKSVLNGPLTALAIPAGWMNRLLTTAWLPPDLRAAYGLSWSDGRARRFAQTVRMLRASRRMMPEALARWPDARKVSG